MAVDPLNAQFDFGRDASVADRRAFRRPPLRVYLPVGTRLYRFTTQGVSQLVESPWWFTHRTWRQLLMLSSRTGAPLVRSARSRLAVQPKWNPRMDWLSIIRLAHPAWGFQGVVEPQPLGRVAPTVVLLGGFEQIYVPGLRAGDLEMTFYGHVG